MSVRKTRSRHVLSANVVVRTTRRQFVYLWTAQRSLAVRILLTPLFLGATLVVLLLGVLLLTVVLVTTAIVVTFLLVGRSVELMGAARRLRP